MSAGNAFATAHKHTTPNGHDHEDQHPDERPFKRQRSSEMPLPMAWYPTAQSETSLEVDIMILDYLAFQATRGCLASRTAQSGQSGSALPNSLQLFDAFHSIFKQRNPQYLGDSDLRLRLLLVKMATLFTQRFTLNPSTPPPPNLHGLRHRNRQRAERWTEARENDPSAPKLLADIERSNFILRQSIPQEALERNRAHVLHQLDLPAEDEDHEDSFYGTAACMTLLDLIPLFIELSAASTSIHGSSLTSRWMHLACELMLQAAIEQYLVCGASRSDALVEAFAWGYLDADQPQSQGLAEHGHTEINEMFEDDTYAVEVEGWDEIKKQYLHEILDASTPGKSSADQHDVASHLEEVASKHSTAVFEASMLKFLEALSASIPEPVLAQLEKGQMEGMTKEETQNFLLQCDVRR